MNRTPRWSASLAVQCACTALVALGAAYASYRHGRTFALRFGADQTTAAIWPLIVDGLLVIATVELWKRTADTGRRTAWASFAFGISLSLCANIGAAENLTVLSVIVAASPPIALLLAVELFNRALHRSSAQADETTEMSTETAVRIPETESETAPLTAEQRMWQHFVREHAHGRIPTGAELDRVANTHNYGRRVLRGWKATGRLARLENEQERPRILAA
ncbi:DUF2637 domain-containing protein [Amycolatopsis circi]|uniref:DUF2637 domain-containing protein n=1 Tax=Amycolatopsis circi TaxID=871959 RepID=UPI000E249DEC|nr:DUF2637 domain-containing protein [Amycolatopsis circi]